MDTGSLFGQYEVLAKLGEGGMGEVYRARDTQLKRDVALKILPAALASDAERLARFQREAEILASLNHSNIAHIYGIANADPATGAAMPARALVMELVEGPTLADRLVQGALPLGETLIIGRQIAEALENAHDRGIVHRDLKPANVKVTPDDVVKVLDFGLAKALDPATGIPQPAGGLAHSPTITSPAMTHAGVILGTAAYMSPEQARGRAVDARADIWSFGCVVFEMLTGRSPFAGESITDVLGAIVHKEPEWSLLPPGTPERLRRLLQRCLTKDVKQRLHSIGDARLEIEDVQAARGSGAAEVAIGIAPVRPAKIQPREIAAWVIAAVAVVALLAGVWLVNSGRSGTATDASLPLRLSIVHTQGDEVEVPAISPDGRRVAYAARGADGLPVIWVRDLHATVPRAMKGTEDGNRPFWSPDSKQLGFVVDTVVKRMPADGGPVVEVTRGAMVGAAWGPDDTILFAAGSGIRRVSASGGPSIEVTKVKGPDWEHMWPSFLPDGRHFLFTAKHWAGLAESGEQGIYLASLDGESDPRRLLSDLSSAVFGPPGDVLFAREDQLMAAPFDAKGLQLTADPIAVGEEIETDTTYYLAPLSAASNGTIALRPPPTAALAAATNRVGTFVAEFRLLKRDGTVLSRFSPAQQVGYSMALSPDARTVAVMTTDSRTSATDLWQYDLESGARTPLTSMRTGGGYAGSPQWSPDGTQLAYGCQPPGVSDDVCIRDTRTGAVTTIVESKTHWEHPVGWSADGQYILVNYNENTSDSRDELYVWSTKTRTLTPFVKTAGVVRGGKFSPDSRFVAYSSTETGRAEVFVTTFPERRQTWQLTTEGGRLISWGLNGKEILVGSLSRHIMAYPVETKGGTFVSGSPQTLIRNVGYDVQYATATPDHSRILIRVPKDADKDKGEIRLLFGWANGLK